MVEKTHEQKMKEMREEHKLLLKNYKLEKAIRREKNKPTVWYHKESGSIEIHFKKRTMLAKITGIDTETPRDASDDMAKGANFRQINYQTEKEE